LNVTPGSSGDGAVTFHINDAERQILEEILGKYPLVPAAQHRVTRQPANAQSEEWQQLLNEAVAEQRKKNRQHVADWLGQRGRFQKEKRGWKFTVEAENEEWFLQVMNDARVGSWLLLGSPEKPLDPRSLKPALLRAWVGMEVSAWFQMSLLHYRG
jgi:hypothetical protein